MLQRHPEEGARLIGPLADWLGEWAAAVDSHHERYDGAGYPRGLSGSQIPLAGRIVAVTDSFETMTAVRSYKRAMSFADARAELQRCAGAHFDPGVVRVMYGVSLPRLMWALGPLAALGHIPFIALLAQGSSLVPAIGEAARTAALAGAASVALTGMVALQPMTTAAAAGTTPTPPSAAPLVAGSEGPDAPAPAPSSTAELPVSGATAPSTTTTPGEEPSSTTTAPVGEAVKDDPPTRSPSTTIAPSTTGSTTTSPSTTTPATTVTVKPTKPTVAPEPVLTAAVDVADDVIGLVTTLVPVTLPVDVTIPDIDLDLSPVTLPTIPHL